jgi:hypothetical protein
MKEGALLNINSGGEKLAAQMKTRVAYHITESSVAAEPAEEQRVSWAQQHLMNNNKWKQLI